MTDKSRKIAHLNDEFRRAVGTVNQTGIVLKTQGIDALSVYDQMAILQNIRVYSDFDKERNDPYGEHDFGRIEYHGQIVYWKIEYYDNAGEIGSSNPSDPAVTRRAMTIMLAHEW